jgi:hypothetical protein
MDEKTASKAIESLRKGIPPDGMVREFTVGREEEIHDLSSRLKDNVGTALLLKANYGSGKTHLLRFIREEALENDYLVSTITIDSKSAVRFNRMDQVFGAICRNIEIPSYKQKGLKTFFNLLDKHSEKHWQKTIWKNISNNGKWDYSEELESPGMFLALRAWKTGDNNIKDLVEDWLYNTWTYQSQRKILFAELVYKQKKHFSDPRPEWKFYEDNVFVFNVQAYTQSWSALRDLNALTKALGYNGLIVLFDEFEDIITNMKNVAHQESAFWNLFTLYYGKKYPEKTFFAVTPEFEQKCKDRLKEKERFDFDLRRFDELPVYEMSPLEIKDLDTLIHKIIETHGKAYEWNPLKKLNGHTMNDLLEKLSKKRLQDRTRFVITEVVKFLDHHLEE